MPLLGSEKRRPADHAVWTACTVMYADAQEVLRALTDPDVIAGWAPVSFEVDGLAGGRLRAGCRERVSGSIAGVRAAFEIEVQAADTERLELVAHGPVVLDVAYSFGEHDRGLLVEATVAVRRRRGLVASVLQAAVAALLDAGALAGALRRLEQAISQPSPLAAKNCLATVAGSC